MNKILIVDNDELIQLLYADELTEEGYEVITSNDGLGLMELIQEEGPDLIVMEIRLGEYDGLDLLQDIRNAHYNLPVILCTAYPSYKYDLRSIAADYYVVKSSGLADLKFKIKMALESGVQPVGVASYGDLQKKEPIPKEQTQLRW
jgi:two-component system response regulator (stage 0 sporulation protein F)